MNSLSKYKSILKSKDLSEEQINDIIFIVAATVNDIMLFKLAELQKEDLNNLNDQDGHLSKSMIAELFEKRFNISVDEFLYNVSSRLFEDVLRIYENFEELLGKLKILKGETKSEFIKLISQEKFEEASRLLESY